MKKSIFSKWHVKLALIFLCAVGIYLVVESFKTGYKEGTAIKSSVNR